MCSKMLRVCKRLHKLFIFAIRTFHQLSLNSFEVFVSFTSTSTYTLK